jgi:predicted ATPase
VSPGDGTGPIRTPDQRLRVFVSSTLKELAAERKAARVAIEKLRLAPVMFELGARPHPPRDLYRAYLEQSDVFVGLYWEKYGWVAPEEDVSGLEDEYNLAPPGMPKLMYIKETTREREPRLLELLARVREDDMASFKYFSDAAELGEVLQGDLAVLLAERFDQSKPANRSHPVPEQSTPGVRRPSVVPAPLTQLIGRQNEVAELRSMLRRDSVRMLTLVGPGGIGKSRLAIEVATAMTDDFPGGVLFVPLAPVDRAELVTNAIAAALGVRDVGDMPLEDKLTIALRHRRTLLLLDNFEQVLGAAPMLVDLLAAAPQLKMLITSRALLRVSGEHSFEVGPLGLPTHRRSRDLPASVALFVERARSVKPDFELTPDNIAAVEQICVALEGVPLALELAAARTRILSPASLLERLDRQLTVLVGGRRDLPPRQQALRTTIEWSTQLLGPEEKSLLTMLGVFAGRFSLEAVERLWRDESETDVLTVLGALVDNSLVRQHERNGHTYFALLATVREYALEQEAAAGSLEALRDRHARYYADLADRMESELRGARQAESIRLLGDESDNIRAAIRHLLDKRDWDAAARFASRLFLFWWLGGLLGEVGGWMDRLLREAGGGLPDRTRAIALYFIGAVNYWQRPEGSEVSGLPGGIAERLAESADLFARVGDTSAEALSRISLSLAMLSAPPHDPVPATAILEQSLALFREAKDPFGEGMALVTLGRLELLQYQVERALERFHTAVEIGKATQNGFSTTVAQHHLGWGLIAVGALDEAEAVTHEALATSTAVGHQEGVAYGLEGLLGLAAARGEIERAGVLYGASLMLREQVGLYNPAAFAFHQPLVAQLRAGEHRDEFDRGVTTGRMLSPEEAIAYAMPAPAAVGGGSAE